MRKRKEAGRREAPGEKDMAMKEGDRKEKGGKRKEEALEGRKN